MNRAAGVTAAAVTIGLAALAMPAAAITNGQQDEGRHPNVGALGAAYEYVDPDSGATRFGFFQFCSGTLLDNDAFLTAAHCLRGLDEFLAFLPPYTFAVSFEDDLSALEPDDVIPVVDRVVHPASAVGLGGNPAKTDIGLALLEDSPDGVEPARLPEAGLVDTLNGAQRFTAVGFGNHREDPKRKGYATIRYDGLRRFAEQRAIQANPSWLLLSMNPATGNGGTCNGDSGGPHFLGTGANTTPGTVVSVTSWGDGPCRASDWTARVDTPAVLDFIREHTG